MFKNLFMSLWNWCEIDIFSPRTSSFRQLLSNYAAPYSPWWLHCASSQNGDSKSRGKTHVGCLTIIEYIFWKWYLLLSITRSMYIHNRNAILWPFINLYFLNLKKVKHQQVHWDFYISIFTSIFQRLGGWPKNGLWRFILAYFCCFIAVKLWYTSASTW